ncbi:hypothetical protein BGW38_010131, partial [Lunasporangiospora selenospora]
ERFGVTWEKRETTISEKWTYEVKTYEEIEEVEEVVEVVEETEAQIIIAREMEIQVEDKTIVTETKTIESKEEVAIEHVTKEKTIVVEEENKTDVEVIITKESGVVAKPAVSTGSSWFRRAITGAGAVVVGGAAVVAGAGVAVVHGAGHVASGAGHAASGALEKVDGVWRRTVQVLTTRKAKVDHVCPIANKAFVYYDEDVYDATLVDKSTGVTH